MKHRVPREYMDLLFCMLFENRPNKIPPLFLDLFTFISMFCGYVHYTTNAHIDD